MGVARDRSHALHSEVERVHGKAGLCKKGNKERAETAVDVKTDVVFAS